MADVSSPVEVLRAAADRLDQLAAEATPGPWSRQPRRNSPQIAAEIPDGEQGRWIDGTRPDGSRELVTVVSAPTWSGHMGFVRKRSGRDLDYVAALGPQVAPALSAWLQTTASMLAERLDALDRNPGQYQGAAQVHAAALARVHGFYEPALRFAGLVLGLPAVSDTTGEGHRG